MNAVVRYDTATPHHTMQMQRSSVRTVFLVLFVCAYLVFGAIIFSLLEEKPEQALKLAVRARRLQFLLNNSCLQGTYIVVCLPCYF